MICPLKWKQKLKWHQVHEFLVVQQTFGCCCVIAWQHDHSMKKLELPKTCWGSSWTCKLLTAWIHLLWINGANRRTNNILAPLLLFLKTLLWEKRPKWGLTWTFRSFKVKVDFQHLFRSYLSCPIISCMNTLFDVYLQIDLTQNCFTSNT